MLILILILILKLLFFVSVLIVNDNQYHLNVFIILILVFSLLTIFMLIITPQIVPINDVRQEYVGLAIRNSHHQSALPLCQRVAHKEISHNGQSNLPLPLLQLP